MKVATIGFFDGVHRGHQYLIQQVKDEALRKGGEPSIVTFVNSPKSVVRPAVACPLLTTLDEKLNLIADSGILNIELIEFNGQLAKLTAREFMQQLLHDEMEVGVLVIGYDNRFGYNRAEGFDDYVRYGKEIGIEVVRAEALSCGEKPVSSSLIRNCLKEGKVAEANELLGYQYFLEGKVVGGEHIGRTLGYPTANISVAKDKLLPHDGVYAAWAEVGEKSYMGMLNIGNRPTFEGHNHTVEVHLLDFEGDLYQQNVTLRLVGFLREEQKFENAEALKSQLLKDEQYVRNQLAR